MRIAATLMAARKRPTLAGASKKLPAAGGAEAKDARHKATFDLPPELMAELRVASTLAGETLASIAERGLSAELQRLRDEIMGGKRFPLPVKARKGRSPKA